MSHLQFEIPPCPPVDGSLLVSETVDFHVKHRPDSPAYVFAKDESSDEITEISYLEFARACHRVAHIIRPNGAGSGRQVVAVIALSDTILYQALTLGIHKAGFVPFPISPRNSPAAVVNLFKKTSCHRLITTQATLQPLLDGVKSEIASDCPDFELLIEEVPSLSEIFPKLGAETASDPFTPYPTYKHRPKLSEVAFYLHSSGSTGLPKAIPLTEIGIVHWGAFPTITSVRDYAPALRMGAMALPPFHTLGIYLHILTPFFGGRTVSVYTPTAGTSKTGLPMIPTPQNILDHTRRTKSNSLMIIPALLQVWSQSREAIDFLKTLEVVSYSGGGVPPRVGDLLTEAGVTIHPIYGATEFGAPTPLVAAKTEDRSEWSWMRFSDRANLRWVPQGDGTYECQVLTTETHQFSVYNLPDVEGYATSDIFEKHPTKEGLWRVLGRKDDVIVHLSGEKTVPGPMEDVVMSSSLVQGAVMFGRHHNQAGILIEPKGIEIDVNDQQQLADLRNKLWPIIEEANNYAPAFSRIFKEMILVTSPGKPMLRVAKGTVMKKATLEAYDPEIQALYETVEASTKAAEAVVPPENWTEGDLEAWLLTQAADIHSGKEFSPTVDLFQQGFDSLSATFLRHRIVAAIRSYKDSVVQKAAEGITQTIVYSHPTIKELSAYIITLTTNSVALGTVNDRIAKIEEMIAKYSVNAGSPPSSSVTNGHQGAVVLLTGTTGGLGSHLLASLLQDGRVERVYAFNRPSGGSQTIIDRQRARFEDRGLDVGLLGSEKLVSVEGDASEPNLGLPQGLYEELRASVSLIIHNAWKLDFNLSLSSFEPNVRGTRNLMDLALSGPHASTVRFLFTSSITSAQSWDRGKGPYPEEVLTDASGAVGTGYGEAKYVVERILAQSGLQASSFRIGQICGGEPNGAWSVTDWVPIMVKSSLALGALPDAQGLVSWLPMDAVSQSILNIAFTKELPPPALNFVHPRPVDWKSVVIPIGNAVVKERNLGPKDLQFITLQEWFQRLEERAKNANEEDFRKIPAIKLLEFFRYLAQSDKAIRDSGKLDAESGGLTKFTTQKAQSISPTMGELRPVGDQDAGRWVSYWNAVGLFD